MLSHVFGGICPACSGVPCLTLDTPRAGRGRDVVDFLKIGNALMRQGPASVRRGVR